MSASVVSPHAETIGRWLASIKGADLPPVTVDAARKLFIDVAGLCLAARHEEYVAATLAAIDDRGLSPAQRVRVHLGT